MDDCKNYFLETGRRVSFEYTLLGMLTMPGSMCLRGIMLKLLYQTNAPELNSLQLGLMTQRSMLKNLQSYCIHVAVVIM